MATSSSSASNLAIVPTPTTLLKDVKPMLHNIDCDVIVLQKEGDPIITRSGEPIYKFTVADKTGAILLSVWGERGQCIKSGDILRLTNAESRIRKGMLEMEALRMTKVKRLGQDTFPFIEKPNYSEQVAIELQQQQPPTSFPSFSTGPQPPLAMMPAFADRRPSPGPQQQQRRGHLRGRGRGDPRRGRGMMQHHQQHQQYQQQQ